MTWRAGDALRVWAPRAGLVEAVVGGVRLPMQSVDGGWWEMAAGVDEGVDYAFSINGGSVLPDPRSRWQPEGVHGPSRTVDPSEFDWTDSGFTAPPLSSALVYELHVGTFTSEGTFDAAIVRLDHLVQLGVTHLELMPVAQFPGSRGWGYDGVDLFAVHTAYGGPQGLARFVDACHAAGLAVLLDVVYNHLGPSGNYLAAFGPYFTERYRTPWGPAVNLDGPGSDEVRRFFVDNALFWLRDYHFDGLRIDAVHAIVDTSAVHFLEELAVEVDALEAELDRHLVLIAESDLNDPRIVTDRARGGYGIDAQWSDDLHHALHAVLTGETSGYYADFGQMRDLAATLRGAYRYAGDYSVFRQRRHGRPAAELSAHRFLGYLQNHDQIGNRARGERSSALMPVERLMTAAAVVLLSPFVPMLFQGEEWGAVTPFQYFTDHEDVDLGRAVSAGRRAEFAAFGWQPDDVPDPQAPETFERSKLDWSELEEPDHQRLVEWHRLLIHLRRSRADLNDGRLERVKVEFDEAAAWFWFRRGSVLVAFNLGDTDAKIDLSIDERLGARLLLGSSEGVRVDGLGVRLPPDSVAVAELRG